MKYIKPEIEINEVLSEDILNESSSWGNLITGSGQLGLEDGQPIVSGDASDFVG